LSSSDPPAGEDFADLFQTAPCGYVSTLPDGSIVTINRTLAQWLGRVPEELVGRPLYDILSLGGRIAFETHLAPLLRMQGHVHEIAIDLLHSSGDRIPMIGNAAEKRDQDGTHRFTRLTLLKAVDRRTYERSLLERRVAAEEEAATVREGILLRDQFIAVLGHDLRNPLAAITAGTGMLRREKALSDTGQTIVGEIGKSLDRAWGLIDDLLDLARGSLGGGFIVQRAADEPLAPVLEHVVSEIRAIAPDREIESPIAFDEAVYCDCGRIAQLASNLLANAVTHGAVDRPIVFEASTPGDRFQLEVANGGEPIPEAALTQLFQPFFRGQARPSLQGLGLGLYISSEIAKAHGGTLEVRSDKAETRFTFTMPRLPVD